MLRKTINNITILWIFVFCVAQLSGCSFIGRKSFKDGPPSVDFDASLIPDATPKLEPKSRYGNRDYTVRGQRYHVLSSAKDYKKRGLASWYGTGFHGRPTSTNESYNLFGMTAASKELPLPTYVEVRNLLNNKKVIVKVNDRGPFRSNRILDLSYAAAKKLGFSNKGTAPVEVTAIDPLTWNKMKIAKKSIHHRQLYLQVAAFAKLDNARKLSDQLEKIVDNPVRIAHTATSNNHIYKVVIGPLASNDQYNHLKKTLQDYGYKKIISVIG